MKTIFLSKEVTEYVNSNLILISGSARSGTSLLGSIIHSMNSVEYAYEPPLLFTLFPLLDCLEKDQWKVLFETYVYEDLLIGQLSGRACNGNVEDYSSFIRSKGVKEYENRLEKSLTKTEAMELAKTRYMVLKCPDLNTYVPKLREYYPEIKIIHTVRSPIDTVESLVKKGWFNNASLGKGNVIWPMRKTKSHDTVPFWVDEMYEESWMLSGIEERAAMYYNWMTRFKSDLDSSVMVVNYDEFVTNPYDIVRQISLFLGVSKSRFTDELVSQIYTSSLGGKDKGILTLSNDLYENMFVEYNNVLASRN